MTGCDTVLIVDDDKDVRESLRALLESAGHTVRTYLSARSLLADDIAGCGCLIMDIRMPDMDGLELQAEVARRGLGLPVVMMSGHDDIILAIRAMKAGAIDFLIKPFDNGAILASVDMALKLLERPAGAYGRRHGGAAKPRIAYASRTRRLRAPGGRSLEQGRRRQAQHLEPDSRGSQTTRLPEAERP